MKTQTLIDDVTDALQSILDGKQASTHQLNAAAKRLAEDIADRPGDYEDGSDRWDGLE